MAPTLTPSPNWTIYPVLVSFWDRVSLWSLGQPQTRGSPTSAWVYGYVASTPCHLSSCFSINFHPKSEEPACAIYRLNGLVLACMDSGCRITAWPQGKDFSSRGQCHLQVPLPLVLNFYSFPATKVHPPPPVRLCPAPLCRFSCESEFLPGIFYLLNDSFFLRQGLTM
jgi:hypothetical protein